MTILVTGAAGFIGFHTVKKLLDKGHRVVGVDNINDYYSVALKHDRLSELRNHPQAEKFTFYRKDLSNKESLSTLFFQHEIKYIIHLAAQAGVRYSIDNPQAYIDSNVTGFMNMLLLASQYKVEHLVYASSSSVYGNSVDVPFSTNAMVSHPVSMYAATKRMNELMAHVMSHQTQLPTTGLRFFTVYGPWGRPDMAPMKFADAMIQGEAIDLYNNGDHYRDFTYIDDIVDGIVGVMAHIPKAKDASPCTPADSKAPYAIYNIGAQSPVHLLEFVGVMESALGVTAKRRYLPMQMGDVKTTSADVSPLMREIGYQPKVKVKEGVERFVSWYNAYHN
jgi:UDP-glucuronate 4-epimerase